MKNGFTALLCLGVFLSEGALMAQAVVTQPTEGNSGRVRNETTSKDRLPRDKLMIYRGDGDHGPGRLLPVASIDHWQLRLEEIMAGVRSVMGDWPGPEKRCNLDIEIVEEVDRGSYVRRLITYASEPGSRVPAYLLIPKRLLVQEGVRAPAVLCLHGTDNVIGHGTVVGLGQRPNRQYASELAERGYVTLAPSYPMLANYQPDIIGLGWSSGTLKAVWDNSRGLDLLQSLPFVETEALASIGHSLGGHNSVFTGVYDDRLKVIISNCGLDSFLDYYEGTERVWMPDQGWTQTRYMPRLADYKGRLQEIPFDFHELIAVLAPRHVLIIAPLSDHNFQATSVDHIIDAARPIFELYQCESHLQVEHPDCGHDFPNHMRERAYKLLDKVLLGIKDWVD